jgi:hypothetical protein
MKPSHIGLIFSALSIKCRNKKMPLNQKYLVLATAACLFFLAKVRSHPGFVI